ncbi:MAG: hypothetical protein FWD13_13535 [Treponema sp.]|nr:hypothetical protein [Treponema sp.]
MFKFIIPLIFIVIVTACPVDYFPKDPPENIALSLTVINNMDTSISVNIRNYYNYYSWIEGESIAYSDWINVILDDNEPINISNNTSGNFVLLDYELGKKGVNYTIISSFEIEIITKDDKIYLSGYETEDTHFMYTELCFLKLYNYFASIICTLYTEKQKVWFEADYVLPVTIIINEDGTVSFCDELIEEAEGIKHL